MSQTDMTYRLTNSANINKVKKKEMIEEANEARMKRLNKRLKGLSSVLLAAM